MYLHWMCKSKPKGTNQPKNKSYNRIKEVAHEQVKYKDKSLTERKLTGKSSNYNYSEIYSWDNSTNPYSPRKEVVDQK